MKKILIFGNSGSGKSTLAKEYCDTGGLAHLDLDTLAWEPTDPPVRKPLDQSAHAISRFIELNDGWVIEGCYTDLLEQAQPFATEIIFMNLPVEACIANAKARPWEPHKYDSKETQDANLDMLITWISAYRERMDTFSEQAHRALYDGFEGKKTLYINNQRSVGVT